MLIRAVIVARDHATAIFLWHRWSVVLIALLAGAAPAAAQPFAYIVGQRDPSGTAAVVSVIDTATNVRVATIPVGANCLCLNPDGIAIAREIGRVYVTNEFAKSVSVIDVLSNAVVATIPIENDPTAIVASPAGARVYVLSGAGEPSISVIDTTSNTVIDITPLVVLQARGMAITPDGARLYVSTFSANSVIVVDTESMSATAIIPVGNLPLGVDISPDGSRAYVAASASNAVYAIDTATDTVVATIPVGAAPRSARISPDGSRVYAANSGSSTLSVINTQTHAVVATVPIEFFPRSLAFSPDGTRAYVANELGVQVIDTTSYTPTATIPFTAATHGYPEAIVMGRAPGGNTPTAVNERYLTTRDAVLSLPPAGVLANDDTDGGGNMTTLLVSDVTHGTLALNANGSFAYTPSPGFSGNDSFTYRAVNAVGPGNVATVTLSVVTGPQPPAGLYTSAIVGNTVTLRWTPPSVGDTPTGYVLEGGIAPGEVLASIATNNAAPTFTFVAPTGVFRVRMHTLSGGSKSAASNEILLFVNVPAAPSAPRNLLGSVNGSTLSLSWRNRFEGGAATSLFLHVTGSLGATVRLPLGQAVSIANVPPGTYTLRLRAVNGGGISGVSNPVTVTLPGACSGPPLPPTNVLASRIDGLVTVVWDTAKTGPAATSFVVDVTGSYVGSFPTPARTLSGTVGPGTYTVTVSATNSCGTSLPSGPHTIVVP